LLRPEDKHGPVKLKLIQKLNNFTDATISAKRGTKKMINQKLSTLIKVVAATTVVNTVINVQPTNASIVTTFEAATTQSSTYYNQFGNNDDNGSVTVYNQTFNGSNASGDNKNRLAFYDGDNNMVGNFDSSLLTQAIQQMPVATQDLYKGNPLTSPNQNTGEYYAYVNFFTTGTSSIKKVVFSNVVSTGFQSDNHSVATSYNSIRGNAAVPEPLTVLGALTAIAFGVAFKRHAAKVTANSEFESNPTV
jgi:hypothetical protein